MYSLQKNSGMSLIEALVALVIISIGLLGIAALQASGLKFNNMAALRSMASIEAGMMMDMMRANICGMHDASAANAYPDCDPAVDNAFSYAGATTATIVVPGSADLYCRNPAVSCTSAQQAAADLWIWSQEVSTSLPQGAVAIVCNDAPCTNNSSYTISVSWQEQEATLDAAGQTQAAAAATQTFSTVFQP